VCNFEQTPPSPTLYLLSMAPTLLCIHRTPAQLSSLQQNGYELLTATNGSDGLRLFASQPVDAIVLEYHLGLLNGAVVAGEIKRVQPAIPIVMLADDLELPDSAWKSVDALVTKSDGTHFLWAAVHFVLSVKPARNLEDKTYSRTGEHRRPGGSLKQTHHSSAHTSTHQKEKPFSAKEEKYSNRPSVVLTR
jgi:DNA-binding response OmpR family regulator